MVPSYAVLLLAIRHLLCPPEPAFPAAWEVQRFPSLATCQSNCQFAWGYRHVARGMMDMAPYEEERIWWQIVYNEAYECWDVWDDLKRAWEAKDDQQRRGHLSALRRKLGPDLWSRGWMPPPAPVWRFRPGN